MTNLDTGGLNNQDPFAVEEEEEFGFLDHVGDIATAPFRGVAGAAVGAVNLFGGDLENPLGESETIAGGFLEGISQFLVGFIPGVGAASHLGKLGAVGRFGKAVEGTGKLGKLAVAGTKNATAGAIADFTVFDGNDPRMSNLIESIPGIANPLTEFLATDPDAQAGDLTERMKAAIEGVGLGVISGGLLGIFKMIRAKNHAVKVGDTETAAELTEKIAHQSEETFSTPSDDLTGQADELLEPESVDVHRPEEQGFDLPPPEEDILGPEHITQESVEERIGYDPDGDLVVLSRPGVEGDDTMKGFTQFDEFAREPGERLRIRQLKKDADIITYSQAKKLAGRKPEGMSKAEYDKVVETAAKNAGHEGMSKGRGHQREVSIFKESAVHRDINVVPDEPFYKSRAEAKKIKINEIVQNSRVESAIHHFDHSPERAVETAHAIKAVIDDPSPENIAKMAGVINLEKIGERGQRAYYAMVTQEIDFKKAAADSESWDSQIQEAVGETNKMLGTDPAVLAKKAEMHSDNVDSAARFAMGTRLFFQQSMERVEALASNITKWDSLTGDKLPTDPNTGKALSKAAAAEMLHRNIESIHSLGQSVGRLAGSFGRGLNSFKISATRMTENALMRSLELRGGDINHVVKTANRILENMKKGGVAHATSQVVQGTRMGRFKNMVTDYYMFSLLSAPKTLTTNGIGSLMTAVFKPFETWVGSWVGRNILDPKNAEALARAGRVNRRQISTLGDMMMQTAGLRDAIQGGDAEAIRAATHKAWKEGTGQLVPQSAWLDGSQKSGEKPLSLENTNAMLGTDLKPEEGMGAPVQMMFNLMDLPSKTMASTDEFIKQLSYMSHIRAELVEQGGEQGFKSADLESYVNNEMRKMTLGGQAKTEAAVRAQAEKHFPTDKFADPENRQAHIKKFIDDELNDVDTRDGSTVKNRSMLMNRALELAREVTFTSSLNPQKGPVQKFGHFLQQFTNDHAWMRFFTPFVRTPLNLLTFTADRLPLPGLNKDFGGMVQYMAAKAGVMPEKLASSQNRWIQAVTGSDEQAAAEAFGRATTAMGIVSAVGAVAMNSDFITGAGPSDLQQRKVLQATGWQPYSLKVGDTYISYQKLDPFAGALALAADMADVTRFGASDQEVEEIAVGYLAATMENLSSKSYLSGVMDLMNLISDPERQAPKTIQRIAGSLAVPNVFAAQRSFTDDHFDEVQGVVDRIKSRLPFLSEDTNVQRNILGEAVNKSTFEGVVKEGSGLAAYMLPVQVNRTGSNEIDNELADLAFPFRPPSYSKYGVDMRDFALEGGQTAYDRWQQLTSEVKLENRNLRSSLGRLIGSRDYKKLDKLPVDQLDLESPRISLIHSLVNRYRRAAELEMLKEFPELRERTLLQRNARARLKSGDASSSITDLLSGN